MENGDRELDLFPWHYPLRTVHTEHSCAQLHAMFCHVVSYLILIELNEEKLFITSILLLSKLRLKEVKETQNDMGNQGGSRMRTQAFSSSPLFSPNASCSRQGTAILEHQQNGQGNRKSLAPFQGTVVKTNSSKKRPLEQSGLLPSPWWVPWFEWMRNSQYLRWHVWRPSLGSHSAEGHIPDRKGYDVQARKVSFISWYWEKPRNPLPLWVFPYLQTTSAEFLFTITTSHTVGIFLPYQKPNDEGQCSERHKLHAAKAQQASLSPFPMPHTHTLFFPHGTACKGFHCSQPSSESSP